jgi:hypothetical protein
LLDLNLQHKFGGSGRNRKISTRRGSLRCVVDVPFLTWGSRSIIAAGVFLTFSALTFRFFCRTGSLSLGPHQLTVISAQVSLNSAVKSLQIRSRRVLFLIFRPNNSCYSHQREHWIASTYLEGGHTLEQCYAKNNYTACCLTQTVQYSSATVAGGK